MRKHDRAHHGALLADGYAQSGPADQSIDPAGVARPAPRAASTPWFTVAAQRPGVASVLSCATVSCTELRPVPGDDQGTGEQNSWYSSGSEGRGGEGIIEQLPSETSHSVLGLKRFRPLGSRQARQAAASAGTMRGEAGLPRRVTPVARDPG